MKGLQMEGEFILKQVTLEKGLWAQLEKVAEEHRMSRTAVLNVLIAECVKSGSVPGFPKRKERSNG